MPELLALRPSNRRRVLVPLNESNVYEQGERGLSSACTQGTVLLVPPMLLVILHMYTRIPSISTLPSLSYSQPSVRGMHRDKSQVRGFQEWQPAFARSHIRTVGDPDVIKHSETYQESVRNTTPFLR